MTLCPFFVIIGIKQMCCFQKKKKKGDNFKINMLKIFNAINAGAGLDLATPFTNCCLRLFFLEKDCIYLDAEHLYDHIKWEMFQSRALTSAMRHGVSQTS